MVIRHTDEMPPYQSLTTDDERFMFEALKEAWVAYDAGEVPVGAVVVHEGQIIGRGSNQVELLQDATAHAEMIAIGAAAQAFGGWRLENCTLFSTLEPCCMCAGAVFLSRLARVVWGAPDLRLGANGSYVDLFALPHPMHELSVSPRVMTEWCSRPLKSFFQKVRSQKEMD
jgi:tRNA(adenine34) deaminase